MSKCKIWSYELQAPSRSQRRYSIATIRTREELVLGTERDDYASRPRKKKKNAVHVELRRKEKSI